VCAAEKHTQSTQGYKGFQFSQFQQSRTLSMSLFFKLLCVFGWHNPRRRDVQWDGLHYRGECRHCGAEIVRISRKTWRKAPE
jgi:hypothetical protein